MGRLTQQTAYLVALDASLSSREYPLDDQELLIGRDGNRCNIVAAGETISRQHARLVGSDGVYHLIDLDSTNGVFVNSRRVNQETVLAENDLIGLGSPDIFHLRYQHTSSRHVSWKTTLHAALQWRIGRDNACEISLPFEAVVSAQHARLCNVRGKLILVDLESLNGTWVNGVRSKKVQIQPADTVVIGSTYFHFTLLEDGSLEVVRKECGDDIQLECVGISVRVSKRPQAILDDITLSLKPGEFVGILGPSGAGKSTLLKTLNGYLPPSSGTVLLNETPLYQAYQMFRSTIGYVPQDDILHQDLSVAKSLEYVARLRLPGDLDREERVNIVDSTVEALGLAHVKQQNIAQLSGGQRKRVSIGAELLTRPSILFLDEPTAGLDPSVEERIMRHFKKMTHNGTTILITTHILYSLDLLDRVIILSQGKLVFFGRPGEAMEFFAENDEEISRPTQIFDTLEQVSATGYSSVNPKDDICERLAVAERFAARYANSQYRQQHVTCNQTETARQLDLASEQTTSIDLTLKARCRSFFGELFPWRDSLILTSRQARLRVGSFKRALLYAVIPALLALVTMSQHVPGLMDDDQLQEQQYVYTKQLQGIPSQVSNQLVPLLSPNHDDEQRQLSEVIFSLRHEGVQNLPLPMSVMLMCIMTAVFLGTISTCLEISTEKSIYQRERMSSLRIADYLFSKLPLVFLVTMLQVTLFLGLLSLHPHFRSISLLPAWIVLVAMAWSSAILGVFISTLDPTKGQLSVIFAIAVVLPQLILSGGLGPDYFRGLNFAAQIIADCLPAKWGLEMLFTAVYGNLSNASADWIENFVRQTIGFAFGEQVMPRAIIAITLQSLAWLLLCGWMLKSKDSIRL
ncbi:MAG: hypothetical protein CSA21_00400 [Deltaproteobacteria bacterium]|nr:MAG: hypothetical protein CSA21_00400 [Deltaproteobacteria bacterium]